MLKGRVDGLAVFNDPLGGSFTALGAARCAAMNPTLLSRHLHLVHRAPGTPGIRPSIGTVGDSYD